MIEQVVIVLTGIVAIYLTQQTNNGLKRYACLFGIVGQPFWFYTSYQNEQWGIFILTFFYTCCWTIGIKNYWITKKSVI